MAENIKAKASTLDENEEIDRILNRITLETISSDDYSANRINRSIGNLCSNELKNSSNVERRCSVQDRRQIDMSFSKQDRRQNPGQDRRQCNLAGI